jgi:hypothetical protein
MPRSIRSGETVRHSWDVRRTAHNPEIAGSILPQLSAGPLEGIRPNPAVCLC